MVSMSRCLKSAPVAKVCMAYRALVPTTAKFSTNQHRRPHLLSLRQPFHRYSSWSLLRQFSRNSVVSYLLHIHHNVGRHTETKLWVYFVREMICFHMRTPSHVSRARCWKQHGWVVVSCQQHLVLGQLLADRSTCQVVQFIR